MKMISQINKCLKCSIIMMMFISALGCNEKHEAKQDKPMIGLCYDHQALMAYSNYNEKSVDVVVGGFLKKPSKVEFRTKQLFIQGYSKDNVSGEVLMDRRNGIIKIVAHRSQRKLIRELSENEFFRVNQLVAENLFFPKSSLRNNLIKAFFQVLGKNFAGDFTRLLHEEVGVASGDGQSISPD